MKHQGKHLKIYELTNKATGQKHVLASNNPQEACHQVGLLIGDCYFTERKPKRLQKGYGHPVLLINIPCRLCPFQYAECRKPVTDDCPHRPDSLDLNFWLQQASKLDRCEYYGQTLEKHDYELGQKWLPVNKAIEELGD